jgi:GNAT superfamily N-acetyltransferase
MENSAFTFRQAGPEDASVLMELINQAFAIELIYFSNERINLAGVAKELQKGTFILAMSGDKPAGCVYAELRGERGYFGLLAVAPSQQRHGLGTRLITEAEDLCREAGCHVMELRILNLRTELPPYYEKLGYTVTGTEDDIPQDSSALQPYHFIVMEKVIGE